MKLLALFTFLIISQLSYAQPRVIPNPIYGVTIDTLNNLPGAIDSMSRLAKKPTVRICFDAKLKATSYQTTVNSIYPVAYIMGQLVDSSNVKAITAANYEKRAKEYVNLLKNKVDLWEIGNEVNGAWLGTIPTVLDKIKRAGRVVKAAGGKTVLTLYYNDECYSRKSEDMLPWVDKNVDAELKSLTDYLFVSYYECEDGMQPTPNWNYVFNRLGNAFPGKWLGFGESGTEIPSKKIALINYHYGMRLSNPKYIGGNFWWYFLEDMVPYTKTYWQTLNQNIINN